MSSTRALRGLIVAGIVAGALGVAVIRPAAVAAAGAPSPTVVDQSHERDRSQLTLKERSSTKGADEQRVNDCKVPLAERGDRHRPTACTPRAGAR